MRIQSWITFEKHLSQVAKENRYLFLVACTDLYDRKMAREALFHCIDSFFSFTLIKKDCQDLSFDEFHNECETVDLFGSCKVFLLENFEKASKGFVESLGDYLLRSKELTVLIEGEQNKYEAKLYEKLKKELVILDLLKEKPWEMKARALHRGEKKLFNDKKRMSKELLDKVFEGCGKSLSLFMQELEKLICYVGEKVDISKEDVLAVGSLSKDYNEWSVCEKFIWETSEQSVQQILSLKVDHAEFLSLIGQLRYHCQLGFKLQQLFLSQSQDKDYFDVLSPHQQKQLPKYKLALGEKSPHFFTQALTILFDYELKAKTASIDQGHLWISLIVHLYDAQTLGV